MTQEKARELLTGLTQAADGRKTCAYEIADRLMSWIRNPDSGQFSGAIPPPARPVQRSARPRAP